MRIALVIDSLAKGGAERQCVNSAIELSSRGLSVDLIRYYRRNDFHEILDRHGINSVYLPRPRIPGIAPLVLANHLRRHDYDVVHAFKFVPTLQTQMASSLTRIRCLFGGYRAQYKRSVWLARAQRLGSKNLKAWIVNSQAVKQSVMEYLRADGNSIHVVSNGIETPTFRSELSPEQARRSFSLPDACPIVTIAANYRQMKNYEMFFRMAKRVVETNDATQFAIAGHGPLEKHVLDLRAASGFAGRVHMVGHCERIADLYRASDVCVLTSHPETEGVPNVVLESGAAGVPCVATRSGAEEIIQDGETGFLVDHDDHESMARRVGQLISDRGMRQLIGDAAAESIERRFSLKRLGDRLIEVYESGRADA